MVLHAFSVSVSDAVHATVYLSVLIHIRQQLGIPFVSYTLCLCVSDALCVCGTL